MPTPDTKSLRVDVAQSSRRALVLRSKKRGRFSSLHKYAEFDWEPWTRDDPTEPLFPSEESMCAAAEASRTAYSIMHLTKDQLIQIHSKEGFDGFEETMANLAHTAEMLNAVVQMIEGARGRMIASACACLQNENIQNLTVCVDGRLKQNARR